MKSILTIILCFFLELSALFGGTSGTATPTDSEAALYDDNEIVSVIVELDTASLLDGIKNSSQRKQVVENFLESESYEKIVSAQETVKELIKESFSAADFENSFSYSFIADGFSLEIPYKYVDDLERIKGVKSVNICTSFAQPDDVSEADGDKANLETAGMFTGVPEAQQLGYTGKGMVVAVLDAGFELSHEAFDFQVENPRLSKKDINVMTTFKALNTIVPRWGANYYSQKIPYKWDYAEVDKSVENSNSGHGTHVAGIIAGKSETITGVAPDAQLLCMKVFGDEKNSLAKEEVTLAALDDAVKLGADIVNMSLGSASGQDPDNIFTADVIRKLEKAGIAVICSAGNEASTGRYDSTPGSTTVSADLFDYGTVGSPSSYSWCMSVASSAVYSRTSSYSEAINVPGVGSAEISSFSAWGTTADMKLKPEITAPGSNILSSVPGNSYEYYSGTSMAAPYYAGSVALIKQYISEKYPSVSKKDSSELINSILMSTATVFRGYAQPTYYSPRRQGAGLVNIQNALATKAYLTTTDNNRPKLELGEDADGTLEMSFVVHNMSSDALNYKIRLAALTDSYKISNGKYINTLTAKKLYENSQYSVEYTNGVSEDGTVRVEPNSTATVSLKITFSQSLLQSQQEAFKNGFFLDGFVFLESEEEPDLSLPYMAFYGDWETEMLFDNTMYDSEPSYLGKRWGLMVTDGKSYYPLGANAFEEEDEYGIDTKYCAYSEKALASKLKNPYVTASVGLLRNGKRMDFNLFSQAGIFRYCGSTLFDYTRKTYDPDKANIGKLWGGGGLINGNGYVYKVSTTPANYPGSRTTVEFPFVVDNNAAKIESCTYEKVGDDNILRIRISDNRYVMGFEVFTQNDQSVAKVSFKNIDPVDGTYEYELNVSEKAGRKFSAQSLESLKLYVLDYAYNETFGEISLSQSQPEPLEAQNALSNGITAYNFDSANEMILVQA
ncbi:MAG: S8 family serine peptidase, partial [Acutalibacteraceae bacterium]